MKIKLLSDYRGVLTDEEFFTAGEYQAGPGFSISEGQALSLIAAGRAEEVKTVRRVSQPKKKAAPRKRAPRKKKAG